MFENLGYDSSKGLSIVLEKHEGGGHDQSTHGNWADSGSPKLTIIGKNDGSNSYFNENTRVVRYQPEGEKPTDYVLYTPDKNSVYALVKPTDGTTIDGWQTGITERKAIAILLATGPKATEYRSSAKDDNKGTITNMNTFMAHRRRGLASAMLKFHRDKYPELDIQHSHALSEDGKAWSSVAKNGSHDQKTHGSWANGGEISNWNPNDPVPASPRNAGGMTDKIWENWEHGVDGEQYVELYRQYAAEALGLKVPESDMAPGGSLNYLTQRGFGGSSTETAKGHALSILKAIANGSPTQPPLYRGVTELKNDPNSTALVQQLSSLKAGDTIDMPLVSTTRSLGVAAWYAADRVQSGSSPIIMKIQAGAKGVSIAPEKSYYQADHEVITSGKFEVVSVNQVKTPYWKRGIFEPRKTVYTDGSGTSYEVATYSPKRYTSAEAKSIWNTVSAGKLQSLATSKFKLTDDRSKNPNRTVYSSWDLQPPTEFTIVEVKMIEPHVVQKSTGTDHGMKFDSLFAGRPQYDTETLEKHGTHDQKTHGSWANGSTGTTVTGLINKLSEKKSPGFSIDLRTGTSPKDGFIASDMGAEEAMPWKEASKTRDNLRNELVNYMDKHAELLDGSGAFFGGWVDEGTLFLDVSRRYPTRSEGIAAGFANEQKAIYDVTNDSYIYMKDEVDGRTNKARTNRSTEGNQGYDEGRETSLRRQNNRRDDGQPLTFPHVCLGRYQVQKHLEGQHDQGTHGNWAGDRYPTDSVKSARDGAKEYAFQKGLKPDETIDYTKVVANRERAASIADIYENLPKMDRDAVDEYEALASEVEQQFDFMTKNLGVKVSFVAEDPYKTSKEMFDDVSKGNLKVLSTASTGAHPLFSDLQNDKFRAVHDFFGHAATGRGFGQDGEEAAWVHHSQMFTKKARAALTTETRGQNSFFNNRGKQFADQKVALLPEEFWNVPVVFQKIRVIRFAPGLVPILKHSGGEAHGGTNDQSSHGNWAGYTDAQRAGIDEMQSQGPSIEDLDNIINGTPGVNPSLDEMIAIVENNQSMYEAATEGIDERVDSEMSDFGWDDTTKHDADFIERQRNQVYEEQQTKMIDEYISDNSDDIHAEFAAQRGGGDTESMLQDITPFFEEVYNTEHLVKNSAGEVVDSISSRVEVVEMSDRVDQGIYLRGEIVNSRGEPIGNFERTFYKENDTWMVEHDYFKIEDTDYQGLGFGKDFIERSENWYTAREFGAITVGTAWDGARHWAKAGYDWSPKAVKKNLSMLVNVASQQQGEGEPFEIGSPTRKEFDSLMSRAFEGYKSGVPLKDAVPDWYDAKVKPMTSDKFPLPVEFAMLGYKRKVASTYVHPITKDTKTSYRWDGSDMLDDMNFKYVKVITAEGRNLLDGPIDRDGDGLVYDGTAREKPVSTVNLTP